MSAERPEGCICPWRELEYDGVPQLSRTGQDPDCLAHPDECGVCGEIRLSHFCHLSGGESSGAAQDLFMAAEYATARDAA